MYQKPWECPFMVIATENAGNTASSFYIEMP